MRWSRAVPTSLNSGVPFSDPMADGPTIQRASERALKHGVGLRDVLGMVSEFRQTDATTPVVLMGYANPIEAMTWDGFCSAAAAAGVDGVLTVDYPPEESGEFAAKCAAAGLDNIYLLAPTTPATRRSGGHACPRLHLLCFAERRDWRCQHRHE
jgi:tryptophan synthase alpha chain